MNVHHVAFSIDPTAGGGIEELVPKLCESVAIAGDDVHLHVLQGAAAASGHLAVTEYRRSRLLSRAGASRPMATSLRAAAASADIIHSHGLWMMPSYYSHRATQATGARHVVSPHGMLEPWSLAHRRWRKRLVWGAGQRRVVRGADMLHATSQQEYENLRELGLIAPVVVAPIGVDVPPHPADHEAIDGYRTVLSLGRIHPKKGLDILVRAWGEIESFFPEWKLRIVGPDQEGHSAELRRLATSLGATRVSIEGPVFGPKKEDAFRQASLFALATHSENFGITVAEALAYGVPALVTREAPWQGLETHRCGWWVRQGVESVAEGLKSALAESPDQLRGRGLRGREWMSIEHSWERVGAMMSEAYSWLVNGGPRPPLVMV